VLGPTLLARQLALRAASARGHATALYYVAFDLGIGVASAVCGACPPALACATAAGAAALGAVAAGARLPHRDGSSGDAAAPANAGTSAALDTTSFAPNATPVPPRLVAR
jgi:hypothetical protein